MLDKISPRALVLLLALMSASMVDAHDTTADLNPCATAKCENFAKCVPSSIFNYTCECNNYWTGEFCQLPSAQNPCFSSPCKQDSKCLLDIPLNAYKCICQPGYTGPACDIMINVCESFPCMNKGFCSNINKMGIRQADYYRCSCVPGFTGLHCEVEINYCESQPCLNSGICIPETNSYSCICPPMYQGNRCEMDLNNATCSCRPGFYGPTCGIEINGCAGANPCNNGVCINQPSGNRTYTCSCFPSQTGENCEIELNLCSSYPCHYGGICEQTSITDYTCKCPLGTLGKNCDTNINECFSRPCQNNGTCVEPALNLYRCICPDNFIGPNCEIRLAVCEVNVCQNGGICSVGDNGISCLCLSGFTGPRCEISLDPCLSNPCMNNGTCFRALNNTFKCICPLEYNGALCDLQYDACSFYNPCQNGATCDLVNSEYRCTCPQFYSGKYCQDYSSICETNPCNNGTCYERDVVGNYTCFCDRGYAGPNCDILLNSCSSNPCKNNGLCNPLVDNYNCICPPGWTSKRCEVEINACESSPCLNGGLCTNAFNFYNCTCRPGWLGSVCQIPVDPCASISCANGGLCENIFGKAYCKCPENFYGANCQQKIDFCLSRPCQNAGFCTSTPNGFNCTCLAGFSGETCEMVQDLCVGYCQNNGTCFENAELIVGCDCPCEYTGPRCETKRDLCAINMCKNGGSCVADGCQSKCECPCGFTGEFCDVAINACVDGLGNATNRCLNGGICKNNNCNFTCECTAGFTGALCQIPVNTCNPNQCQNDAICVPYLNDYQCVCPCSQYSGKNCEIYDDICQTRGSECLNGGSCVAKGCDIQCACPPDWTGARCQQRANPCTYNLCFNNGTCIANQYDDTFQCVCTPQYTGSVCLTPVIIPVTTPAPGTNMTTVAPLPCSSSPCGLGRFCQDIDSTNYTCACPPNYTGARCEVRVKACDARPCRGGMCMENYITGGFICNCALGTTGERCETDVNPCDSNPCQNSGTCRLTGLNRFACDCAVGTTGTICEALIDPCQSYPCWNGGQCSRLSSGAYECNCNDTCFSGQNCEIPGDNCENKNCGTGTCLSTGKCTSQCVCPPGSNFSANSSTCYNPVDICASNPCMFGGTCVSIEGANRFYCTCPVGFTGTRCSTRLVACSSDPCQNDGFCIENANDSPATNNTYGFSCVCQPGWTGPTCDDDINECAAKPCQNNGLCVEQSIDSYTCFCKFGYTGANCESLIDICSSNPCLNSLNCSSVNGTLDCTCKPGFYGVRCELEVNECLSMPCANGGICINKIDGYECKCPVEYAGERCNQTSCNSYCYNGGSCVQNSDGPYCVCAVGFEGPRCERINNPCLSNPCRDNQGKCISAAYGHFTCECFIGFTGSLCETAINVCSPSPCIRGECYSDTPGLTKCRCPAGYTGRFCETSVEVCAAANPCQNGGTCNTPFFLQGCPSGLTGPNCGVIIDTCASNPCQSPDATCVQTRLNEYKCVCPPYLTGNLCQTKINPCDSRPCVHGITCVQTSFLDYKCLCPPGFTGPKCGERFDVCQSNPCLNGDCVAPNPGTYRCSCHPGFKGPHCDESVFICDYRTCLNGGYCVGNTTISLDASSCICPNGYTGRYCEAPIDVCANQANPTDLCGANGVCHYSAPGQHHCRCKNECYFGDSCQNSTDPCDAKTCRNGGACVGDKNTCTSTCSCQAGFTGENCEINLDPCLNSNCMNGGTCVQNSTTSFTCACTANFQGPDCGEKLDLCANYTCENGGLCHEDNNYYQPHCLCQYGFTGLHCENVIDFCYNKPCLNNGVCESGNSTYSCNCTSGFVGQRCQGQVDECALKPCVYGNCFSGSAGSYKCLCHNGWTGSNCDVQIDFCTSNPCQNGNCTGYQGGYSCKCESGFQGKDCDQPINRCAVNPCQHGTCSQTNTTNPVTNSTYSCACDAGYEGANCQQVVDLCPSTNCSANGTCRQLSPFFAYCDCDSGYRGKKCEKVVDSCALNTCYNGGTCNQTSPGQFTCQCITGFTGTFCEFQQDMCLPNPCENGATCTSSAGSYQCQCPANFEGPKCQFAQICTAQENPCQNGAVCKKNVDSSFDCTCNPGFTGRFCETVIDACNSNPCQNGASCFRFNFTEYVCSCPVGFSGQNCQNDINECSLNPCQNNGQCVNTFGTYSCVCPIGFAGKDCEQTVTDPCLFNSCSANGTDRCVATENGFGYECKCKPSYGGVTCNSLIPPCMSNPCSNGATCVANVNQFTCVCPIGRTGANCETEINYCVVNNPCGGFGTCTNTPSNYTCTCFTGFSGRNCEIKLDTCSSQPCQNGATCVAGTSQYTCMCTDEFEGTNCENKVDPCLSYACYNGGTCTTVSETTFCRCAQGFGGPQCQFNIGCQLNCQNGGTCSEAGNMCQCPSDWTGLECTVSLNACLSNPCQNGAQCNSTSSMVDGKPVNAYTCACSANFTGANCETRLTACSSNPCLNDGVCKSDSLTNHTCTCFSPYFGANCENKLSLCSFLSCGQGQCVVSADGYNASCVCNEGWIGANCNLQPSACLSSPCRNGAQCLEVVGGGFTCNCTDEYEGPTCETAKTCVQSFDYCSSMPCLNGGVCTPLKETCSFTCKCDNQVSYGEFCQFSIAPNVFTGQGSVNILSSDVVRSTIFNQEVRPCLTSAWQQANPQFACPQGYQIIPGITGCFKAMSKTKAGFNRANSEYECSLTGGSLVALETEEKSNAIKAWLKDTVKTTAKYFWLNTATRRDTSTPFSGNWTWLWISTQNNSYAEFGYDNWGSNQSTNFNGDSVYLATKDYKLYVAVGKDAYFNGTESIGVLCETTKNSLTKSQINVVLTEQSQAYTLAQQTADQFKYTVNITLSGSIKASEVKEPTLQLITSELATCGKTVLNASASELFTKDSTFSVDVCGADLSSNVNSNQFNQLLSSALLKAWLRSRPEFTYCSQNRNCVKINVLNTEKVALDASNAVMRIRYVIRVNSVLISPSDPDAFPPNAAMLQEFVNALPRNNFENFLLCGAKNESLVASLPQAASFFGLTLNKFIFDSPAMVDSLKSAIKMAVKNVSSSLDEAQMRVEFNSDHESLYPVRSMPYSMDDINNQPVRNTFKLFYQDKIVSHATQSLFLESKFLEALQSKIASDDKLPGVSVTSFANYVGAKHLFEITLRGRLRHLANVVSNTTFIEIEKTENIKYKKFIADEKIEFNFCKKCYLTPSKYSLVLIGSEIGVDSTSARCYFHYFAVKYEDEFTGTMRLARITEEVKLMEAIKKVKPQLQMTANSEITLFLANRTVSMEEMPPTRRYADAVHLQLTQSLLSEDVSKIVATIKSAVQSRPNSPMSAEFIVQYWGQSEFIKDTKGNGVSITYWQPLFYVVNPTSGVVYKPKFDFTVNQTAINSFLVSFNSSRLNFYGSSLPFDKENDYIISDLFKLPCYGQTFVQTYTVIMQIMQNEWTKYFQANNLNEAATTISLQTFSSFSLPYVSYKGYFSVLPFGIRTAHGMITPDVFSGPLLSNLKTAMSGFCDIQDPIDQISRQASLNYVQASGYLTIDQANEYIPSITAAYETFFASFSYPVKIEKPTVIRSIENRFVNQIIVTRIYYQLFGNTSQPLNAFNYQIKTTRFTIQPPSNLAPLVKRSLRIMNEARVDLLNKERITDLDTMLDTLPQIAIDSEITEDQKQGLVDSLKKFWTTELRGRGQQVNSIEVQLGTTQKYINTQTSSHVTYVYYIMAIDGVVHLRDSLPELSTESETKLNTELHTNGFSLSRGPYVKTRTIYIDADSATVAFNEGEALNSIKSAWIQYLSASDVSVISSNINIWWIDQNIYYDLDKPFIGIRYAITLNKQDPSKIPVPDPSKDYFEPFFQPFKVYGGTPFKARRLYVFSSIIKDVAQFKNAEYMKNKISEIWDAKNPLTDPTYKQSTYITPFFATSNTNLYGNVQNSPIVRATYTQSINGLEPLALFHKNPTEDDFSAQFLNPLLDPLITRICFDKCYNYQQNQIYINKKFISDTQSVQKLINSLVASWNEVNQVTSNLLKRNKINIKTIQNSKKNHQRSLVSDNSQQKQVVFNIEIENPNSDTQIDATDLIMPSEAIILKNLQIEFPTITQEDLLPVEITTTTTPVPTTTVAVSTTQPSATTESSIKSTFQKKLEWWEGLLIGVGVICFAAIVITSLVVCCKRRGIHRSLLSNAGSSSGSSAGGSKGIKDQFAHLASTFPQGNADFNGIITRNSFENKQYAGSVRSNASSMNPSELRFVPSARPSVSKNSQNLAVFYPGVPIESIVPNPVFVNNQSTNANNILNAGIYENPRLNLALEDNSAPAVEKLVTSVYVTRQKSMKNSGNAENSESNEECYENQ